MPTYQYACTECDHRFEAVQPFHDAALTECPQCAGKLRKVYGSVGVVFKGSGFYRTDSRAGNGKAATSGDGSSTSSSDSAAKSGDKSTPSSSSTSAATSSGSSSSSSSSAAASSGSSSSSPKVPTG